MFGDVPEIDEGGGFSTIYDTLDRGSRIHYCPLMMYTDVSTI
jgi:hypothetical protein